MNDELQNDNLVQTVIPLGLSREEAESQLGVKYWDLGPMLQGVLMELIDTQYAKLMHEASFNPYSQHCSCVGDSLVWVINTLTSTAFENIVVPVIQKDSILLKRGLKTVSMGKATMLTVSRKELAGLVHGSQQNRFTLRFDTPAAFKSKGQYQVLPSLHLIYQNLLMHYGEVFDADHEVDPETVDYLVQHSRVIKFQLHSQPFKVSGKAIPAYRGSITIEVSGPETLVGFARMLFCFARFSGIGIKTSMGMGGLTVE